MNRDAKIHALLNAPPVNWNGYTADLGLEVCQEVERRASELATQYARLSAYLSRRTAGGRHVDAVKAQNVAARRVRQALGYTYADDKITF